MQLKLGIIKQTNKNSENSYYFRLRNTTTALASEKDLTNASNSVAKISVFLISGLPSTF